MRINQFIARATGLSRRAADEVIKSKRVKLNDQPAQLSDQVAEGDLVLLDDKALQLNTATTVLMLNKPVGYVCSRRGQGNKTVYNLLPPKYHHLKPVGRLDKDSSGLLLLTDDGELANQLTHPSHNKTKAYEISLDKPLTENKAAKIRSGVSLGDGISRFDLEGQGTNWVAKLTEGRNRQIRRTFEALGYKVTRLHRTHFGPYSIDSLSLAKFILL